MFEYNKELKKLPIPLLEKAIENYKKLVRPLLTEAEYAKTSKIADAFIKKGSGGFILHNTLIEKCAKEENKSWLIDLWDKMYLEYRDETVINVNYYAILNNENFKDKLSHSQILGIVINTITKLYFSIIDETLPAQKIKGTPICMKNYINILGATRIPDYEIDKYYRKEKNKKANHVIFMYKGYMYKILVSDKNGLIYSPLKISNTIEYIIKEVKNSDKSENVGIITCAKRDKSAFLYKKLMHSKINTDNFTEINQAIAVFCLDGNTQYSSDYTQSFLLSTGKNRFFDKSSQFILTHDKELGINNEHSHADASLYHLVINQIYENLSSGEVEFDKKNYSRTESKRLEWKIPPLLKSQLNQTIKEHKEKAASKFTKNISFYEFGKNLVKSLNISPDTFFHLALQLAQFRTFGANKNTYEALDMRVYREGRTECVRPLNIYSKEFSEKFDILKNNKDTDTIKELIRKAAATHILNITNIKSGSGVERYLFGLEEMNKNYINNEIASKFFNDAGYKKLKEDFISSSNFGSDYVKAFGFGNVTKEGYGIGYNLNKDNIAITICSESYNKDKAIKLIENLHKAFIDIKDTVRS